MIFDPDDEPLEFCAGSGLDLPDPTAFCGPLSNQDTAEIAQLCNDLPDDFTQNRLRLAFSLWCLGRIFSEEIDKVAAEHGLL